MDLIYHLRDADALGRRCLYLPAVVSACELVVHDGIRRVYHYLAKSSDGGLTNIPIRETTYFGRKCAALRTRNFAPSAPQFGEYRHKWRDFREPMIQNMQFLTASCSPLNHRTAALPPAARKCWRPWAVLALAAAALVQSSRARSLISVDPTRATDTVRAGRRL
jgi:hypothetical protein